MKEATPMAVSVEREPESERGMSGDLNGTQILINRIVSNKLTRITVFCVHWWSYIHVSDADSNGTTTSVDNPGMTTRTMTMIGTIGWTGMYMVLVSTSQATGMLFLHNWKWVYTILVVVSVKTPSSSTLHKPSTNYNITIAWEWSMPNPLASMWKSHSTRLLIITSPSPNNLL